MGDPALSISIVIPTLNAGRAFGTILHRIMGQGQAPLEIVCADLGSTDGTRSEEHTSELQSRFDLVCRLLLEKKTSEGNSRQSTNSRGVYSPSSSRCSSMPSLIRFRFLLRRIRASFTVIWMSHVLNFASARTW